MFVFAKIGSSTQTAVGATSGDASGSARRCECHDGQQADQALKRAADETVRD
jgi:hypothetical protein